MYIHTVGIGHVIFGLNCPVKHALGFLGQGMRWLGEWGGGDGDGWEICACVTRIQHSEVHKEVVPFDLDRSCACWPCILQLTICFHILLCSHFVCFRLKMERKRKWMLSLVSILT